MEYIHRGSQSKFAFRVSQSDQVSQSLQHEQNAQVITEMQLLRMSHNGKNSLGRTGEKGCNIQTNNLQGCHNL